MNDGTPRQQIAERIKNATNILVTVSRDPSVDELSAALALTLMLNKMEKHATAVFSGKVPPAITFLEPNKTFESSVDSLRDFIIALDKNKADRLRYKVEDDVVRIFITPYRTTITEKDLQFSQGDFNVELIVALGVERREDLDTAVTAHGRILHDAATITLNTKEDKNSLGVVDWQETEASSLCEMLISLDELLGSKIDEQIATALLTGVVAATQRFKNVHTSPRVMTMAAQLMAAGANQQLIATKLEEAQEIPKVDQPLKDGTTKLDEGKSKKLQSEKPQEKALGEMNISHDGAKTSEVKTPKQEGKKPTLSKDKAQQSPVEKPAPRTDDKAIEEASKELDQAIAGAAVPQKGNVSVSDLKKDLAAASKELDQEAKKTPANEAKIKPQGWRDQEIAPPSMGGTLNATTEDAEEEKRHAEQDDRNRTILTHDKPMGGQPENVPSPINSYGVGVPDYEPPSVDPFATQQSNTRAAELTPAVPSQPEPAPAPELPQSSPVPEPPQPAPSEPTLPSQPETSSILPPPPTETIADIEASAGAHQPEEKEARRAVEDALNSMPFDPAHQPVSSLNAQPLSLPHIEHNAPTPASEPANTMAPPEPSSTPPLPSAPLPPPPPMPDFSSLPPLPPPPAAPAPPTFDMNVNDEPISSPPPATTGPSPNSGPAAPPLPPIAPSPAPSQPPANDPSQFRIPGQ